jgi:hypothetical protein
MENFILGVISIKVLLAAGLPHKRKIEANPIASILNRFYRRRNY